MLCKYGLITQVGNILLLFTTHGQPSLKGVYLPGVYPAGSDDLPSRNLPWPELQLKLKKYFSGYPAVLNCNLELSGYSAFAREVLQSVKKVPYGHLVRYKDLAVAVGKPGAARAIGRVLAANQHLIVIPCHRVLKSDGGLGGFRAGAAWKQYMLELEKNGRERIDALS